MPDDELRFCKIFLRNSGNTNQRLAALNRLNLKRLDISVLGVRHPGMQTFNKSSEQYFWYYLIILANKKLYLRHQKAFPISVIVWFLDFSGIIAHNRYSKPVLSSPKRQKSLPTS